MKANPGSGRIWNLIMGVLRGARGAAAPIVQQMFAASIISGVSMGQWLQQNSVRYCYVTQQ